MRKLLLVALFAPFIMCESTTTVTEIRPGLFIIENRGGCQGAHIKNASITATTLCDKPVLRAVDSQTTGCGRGQVIVECEVTP